MKSHPLDELNHARSSTPCRKHKPRPELTAEELERDEIFLCWLLL
ncbi:MAG: hypothetical protein R3A13_04415 [Bdellovibrionota bacterium]